MKNRVAVRSGILAIALGIALAAQAQVQAPAKHPITFDDLIKMHRVSGSQISRDGRWVAYAVSTPDMELNRGVSEPVVRVRMSEVSEPNSVEKIV